MNLCVQWIVAVFSLVITDNEGHNTHTFKMKEDEEVPLVGMELVLLTYQVPDHNGYSPRDTHKDSAPILWRHVQQCIFWSNKRDCIKSGRCIKCRSDGVQHVWGLASCVVSSWRGKPWCVGCFSIFWRVSFGLTQKTHILRVIKRNIGWSHWTEPHFLFPLFVHLQTQENESTKKHSVSERICEGCIIEEKGQTSTTTEPQSAKTETTKFKKTQKCDS